MATYPSRPSREAVERIAASVARRAGLPTNSLFFKMYEGAVVRARQTAFRRILRETGCSMNGLADVWGCDLKCVQRAVSKRRARAIHKPSPAHVQYEAAIRWHYPVSAAAILGGKDPQTQADIARWNALGRRAAA